MSAPPPEPDPIINPDEPMPDDPAEVLPDAPEPAAASTDRSHT
jgi:hypothetical protein